MELNKPAYNNLVDITKASHRVGLKVFYKGKKSKSNQWIHLISEISIECKTSMSERSTQPNN